MVALLVELWERIARLCRREDLLTLSLVSPTLRDIARRTLAEDITFDGSREHLDYLGVLKFLRDQNLATCVKRFGCLRMSICNLRTPGAIIPFEDMTNLQSLSFTRYSLLCMTAQDQKTFVDAVRRCCPQLVELKIQYNGPPFDEYFAIPNLQKITWDEDGDISDGFISLGRASASTLIELDLTVCINHEGADHYIALSNLYFPKLRVLTFGSGGQYMPELGPDDDHTAQDAYTAFLCAQKTIERLTLTHRYLRGNEEEIYMPFNPSTIPKDFLPNLTYLAAHPAQVVQLVESGANIFAPNSPLLTLRIADGMYENLAGDIVAMSKALSEYSSRYGPVCIRRLIFDCGNSRSLRSRDFEGCVMCVARALPDLDAWEGTVSKKHPDLRVLRHFEKLRELRVKNVHIKEPSPIKELAQDHCHLLKVAYYGEGDDGYKIQRAGDLVVGLCVVGLCHEPGHD